MDLLGYGFSDKPNPRFYQVNELYNFENWAEQVSCFITEVIKEPCVLVCNSVGGLVGLQTAVSRPELVRGIILMNISLRLLHAKKQPFFIRPFVSTLQYVLRESGLGRLFFKQVATPNTLRNILSQAYARPEDVTDEIVQLILQPGLDPGAVDVFLDFISYRSAIVSLIYHARAHNNNYGLNMV
jgi:pimeloyl-ACP methyl ester carboxylesterase